MGSVIVGQRKSEKPMIPSLPPSVPYDRFQDERWKSRTAAARTEERHVVLAKKEVNGMCARQPTVPCLLIEHTVGTSAKAAPWFLDNEECQKFVEQVHGEEKSEQRIKVTKALPPSLTRQSERNVMAQGYSVPQR